MPYILLFGSAAGSRTPPPKSIDIMYHGCTRDEAMKHASIWATNNGLSTVPVRCHEGTKTRAVYPVWSPDQKAELLFADNGDRETYQELLTNFSSCIMRGIASKELSRIAQTESPRIKFSGTFDENTPITSESVDHISAVRKAYAKDPAMVNRALSVVPWGRVFNMILSNPEAFEKAMKKRGGINSIRAIKSPTSGRWSIEVEDEAGDTSKIPIALFEQELGIKNNENPTATTPKKETGIMAKLPSKDVLQRQATTAMYRTAAKKAITMATDAVAIAMEKKLGNKAVPSVIADFLKTDMGKCIFGIALSFLIEQLPIAEGKPQKERVVEEIRIMAMEMGMSELADIIITPLTGLYEGLFANLPKEEVQTAGALAEGIREVTEVEQVRVRERETLREAA